MILVAGGTGRLGAGVVAALLAARLPVRVLTRDARRAEPLCQLGAQVAIGDVRAPGTLGAAVAGVRTVVSAVHGFARGDGGTPHTVDRYGNAALIEAAARAGAEVVLLSVLGAAPEHPLALFRMKAAAEEHLRARLPGSTILRCAAFAELHLEVLAKTASRRGGPVVLGRGDNPINLVSVPDVVSAALAAVRGDFPGQTLDVGGPEDVTLNQLAGAVGRGLVGPDRKVRHVPRPALRAVATLDRLPRLPVGQIAALALAMDCLPMTYDALHSPDAVEWRGSVYVGSTRRG